MLQSKFKLSVLSGIIFILTITSAAFGAQMTFNYTYDDLHRLTKVERSDGSVTVYQYDPAGNRLAMSVYVPTDTDNDGIPDSSDNCPTVANTDQSDTDADGLGDVCDIPGSISGKVTDETTGLGIEGVWVLVESGPSWGVAQTNASGNYIITGLENGNYRVWACLSGYMCEYFDNTHDWSSATNVYVSAGIGTPVNTPNINFVLARDTDADNITDPLDNCPAVYNTDQADADGDGIGDACDSDADGDGIPNETDNCPMVANSGQEDIYGTGFGDACSSVHCVTNSAELQNALNEAQENGRIDIVRLVQGIYGISANGNSGFSYSTSEPYSLVIKGGYTTGCVTRDLNPVNTVFDGEGIDQAGSGGVLYLNNGSSSLYDAKLIVEGITIRNGRAENGGGVSVYSGGGLTISNNIIEGNSANDNAGGLYASSARGDVTGNIIRNNTAGHSAGGINVQGNMTLSNNIVVNNTTNIYGGGILIEAFSSNIVIVNNTITGNIVMSNESRYGGGGGVYILFGDFSDTNLYNNIIRGNVALSDGDINIIEDSPFGIIPGSVSAYNNNYDPAKVSGTFTNEGNNINEDPMFVDAANGDYHLSFGSPCIDSGSNAALNLPSIDFEGDGRILGILPDMGADEFKDIYPPIPGEVIASNIVYDTFVDSPFDLSTSFSSSSVPVTSCQVCVSTDGFCDTEWAAATLSGASPNYICTKTGITGTNGQSLTLNMRATSAGGTGTATAISRTVDAAAPTDGTLTATPSNTQVLLNWTPATDNGSGLKTTDTYKVVRNTGTYPEPQCTNGTQIYLGTAFTKTDTNLTNGTTYYYRVCAYDNVDNISTGATASAKPNPTITVTSPNGGEGWTTGTTQTIRWTYTGNPGPNVKIELLKNGLLKSTIITSKAIGTNGVGTHSWAIPTTLTAGTDYKIKITSTTNTAYSDTSDNNFTINPPTITVTVPNGGESWAAGTRQTIRWTYTGNPGTYVKIELLKGTAVNRVIAASVSKGTNGIGSYAWTIPITQPSGTDYKIRVTSTTSSVYKDTSDNNFTIIGNSITVTAPNGGENWQRGTTKTITWSYTANPGTYVKIELMKGTSTTPVLTIKSSVSKGTNGAGSYPWAIPLTQTAGTTYKIRITSTTSATYKDSSDGYFTISVPPSCTYTTNPANGSTVNVGYSAQTGKTISVTAGSTCAWTASTAASWIQLTSGASGTGNGTVTYSVSANTASATRSGTILIKDSANVIKSTINISQAGLPTTTFKLPDTGQTTCYDADGNVLNPCPAQDNPLAQDGSYAINPLSYNPSGSGTNGVVFDNNTGLMWQMQNDGNYYNWYQASGTYDQAYNANSRDICGEATTGGYSDWRLPTKKELLSIVDYERNDPSINPVFTNTVGWYYWTNTAFVDASSSWNVGFSGGDIGPFGKESEFYVRCVRGGQYPAQSLINNQNETITDNATGLMWQQGEVAAMSWSEALSQCESSNLAGYTNWRLPTIKELESIIDETRYDPAINTGFFNNASPSGYWSSTTYMGYPDYALSVDFLNGDFYGFDFHKSAYNYVRCVRTNQPLPPPTCTYTTNPANGNTVNYGTAASSGNSISITAGATCSWTVTTAASWIQITAGASGTGNGTVTYSVSANSASSSRNGTILIKDGAAAVVSTINISQAGAALPCTYTTNPASGSTVNYGLEAQTGKTISVTAGGTCNWTATSNSTSWLTITGGSSGSGNGTITYDVAALTSGTRSGTITVYDGNSAVVATITIRQSDAPPACNYTTNPASGSTVNYGLEAQTGKTISVTAGSTCSWTASSDQPWISVTAGAIGTGNGSITYSVEAFATTTGSRSGTITVRDGNSIVVSSIYINQAEANTTFKLPDTGQTMCYQDVSPYAEITCPAPGNALAQDGSYNINPKSYTVIGSNSDMVLDNNTGLIWQREDDGYDYNWYQAMGKVNSSYNPSGVSFKNVCGNLRTGGYNDWRVPSKKELISIVNHGRYNPAIDATYFPNTVASNYWSFATVASNPNLALDVDFYDGSVLSYYKSVNYYVRCVRAGQ